MSDSNDVEMIDANNEAQAVEIETDELLRYIPILISKWNCFTQSPTPAPNLLLGGYNRLLRIDTPLNDFSHLSSQPLSTNIGILRMPKDTERRDSENEEECEERLKTECLSEVAIHHFLRQKGFKTPFVYGFSTSSNNDLGTPWIFMEFFQGGSLAQILPTMTLDARKQYIESHVKCRLALEATWLIEAEVKQADKIGKLCCSDEISPYEEVKNVFPNDLGSWHAFIDGKPLLRVQDTGVPEHYIIEADENEEPINYEPSCRNCFEYLDSKFESFIVAAKRAMEADQLEVEEDIRLEEDLLRILHEMKEMGFFASEDKPNPVLYHIMLYARNVMLRPGLDVGLIDFDFVLNVPWEWAWKPDSWLFDPGQKLAKAWNVEQGRPAGDELHLLDGDDIPLDLSRLQGQFEQESELLKWYVSCWATHSWDEAETEAKIKDVMFGERKRLERKLAAFTFGPRHLKIPSYRRWRARELAVEWRRFLQSGL